MTMDGIVSGWGITKRGCASVLFNTNVLINILSDRLTYL